MVVNEASHIFIFCMDRIIYVLNIYNVEIDNGKKSYACFIWLTWSCIWNKGVFQRALRVTDVFFFSAGNCSMC